MCYKINEYGSDQLWNNFNNEVISRIEEKLEVKKRLGCSNVFFNSDEVEHLLFVIRKQEEELHDVRLDNRGMLTEVDRLNKTLDALMKNL